MKQFHKPSNFCSSGFWSHMHHSMIDNSCMFWLLHAFKKNWCCKDFQSCPKLLQTCVCSVQLIIFLYAFSNNSYINKILGLSYCNQRPTKEFLKNFKHGWGNSSFYISSTSVQRNDVTVVEDMIVELGR